MEELHAPLRRNQAKRNIQTKRANRSVNVHADIVVGTYCKVTLTAASRFFKTYALSLINVTVDVESINKSFFSKLSSMQDFLDCSQGYRVQVYLIKCRTRLRSCLIEFIRHHSIPLARLHRHNFTSMREKYELVKI